MSKAAELANLIGNINAGGGGVNRNVIINGGMQISQRSSSETGLGGTAGYHTIDRFRFGMNNNSGRFTMSQDSSAPSGFNNSLKVACTTADTSIASDEQLTLQQRIEGQNLYAFAKGTSDAKPFAISFYVKGNASATYACELFDATNSRQISKLFSVTTDWTRVEITFPADTTGAFDNNQNASLYFNIWLHAGSDFTGGTLNTSSWASNTNANRAAGISSFFDSTSRTFFITGVQLEVGQNPTAFEFEPIERILAKCQRYFVKYTTTSGVSGQLTNIAYYDSSRAYGTFHFPVEMRSTPAVADSGTSNGLRIYRDGAAELFSGISGLQNHGTKGCTIYKGSLSGVAKAAAWIELAEAAASLEFSAEL